VELPVFDVADALKRVEGDRELLAELLAMILQDYPVQLEDIRQALHDGRAPQVERLAHSLKSAMASVSAKRGAEAARRVEALARDADLQAAALALDHLQEELTAMQQAMHQFLQTLPI
jgi:HPt (histidine-containing phosphotransfer) domain-containing protein